MGVRIKNRIVRIYGEGSEQHEKIKTELDKIKNKNKSTKRLSSLLDVNIGLNLPVFKFTIEDLE